MFHVTLSGFVQYVVMMPVVATKCLLFTAEEKVLALKSVVEHNVVHVDGWGGTVH